MTLLTAAGREKLLADPHFAELAFDPAAAPLLPSAPDQRLALLEGEAAQTLAMIEPALAALADRDSARRPRLLEIGGGVGLVHAELHRRGWEIVSLEPGGGGFGDRHRAGRRLLDHLGLDPGGWLAADIEHFTARRPFELIFSHFVLEHLAAPERAFQVMAGLLAPGGRMIHRCPNYAVPYEPHYNLPLLPFYPRLTARLKPALRRHPLWRGLNFITAGQVAALCARHGLTPTFRPGLAAEAFERLLADPLFAARRPGLARPAALLQKSGLLALLGRLPPAWATPMEFTAVKHY